MKDKTVSVAVDNPRDYTVGQQVVVAGSVSQGMKAVVFAFGIPVILLMITLVLTLSVTGDERMTSLFFIGYACTLLYSVVPFPRQAEKEF
jgi:sigma-E factor negative regulatory protein RseC